MKQIAEALQFAHEEKLIHRDIKPENILLGRRGEILLSDFGIALIAQSSRYQSTQEMTGTLAYIAPEQIQGRPRPASDQYSLGIVVYEWLTGDCPFHGAMVEIVAQHLAAPPSSLRAKVPALPPAVEQVVMMALEKDPQRRFANIRAFANALEQASASRGAPTTPAPAQSPSTIVAPSRPPAFSRPASAPRVGTLISSYSGHTGMIRTFHWSPDGKRIASGGDDGKVHVWDPTTGKLSINYSGHSSVIFDAVWFPDGKWIASASHDNTVQVWEAATGKHDFTYAGHFARVMEVAWSPDGSLIASASSDGRAHVWDTSIGYALLT